MVNLIFYSETQDKRKLARPVTSAEEYKTLRSNPIHLRNLEKARGGDAEAKTRLLQFNYSGHYPNGKVKGNKLPSNSFGFDIDDRETFERVSQVLIADPETYGLLMLERSVNQGGHAIFRRQKGTTILENQVRIAQMLHCEMDTSAHDINRVFFATSASEDDLLYLNDELFADTYIKDEVDAEARLLEDRVRFASEILPPGAHKANKHYKPWYEEQTLTTAEESSESAQQESSEAKAETSTSDEVETTYCGIPYSAIIDKWWEMYYGGKTPVKSNRDTLIFELAMNMRHIMGFDAKIMDKNIPCYDGFPHEQKLKCIHSALNEKLTQMPQRLKKVIEFFISDNVGNPEVFKALEKVQEDDDLFYARMFPSAAMPMGVKDSVNSTGAQFTMPALNVTTACIGFLADKVNVKIHGEKNPLVQFALNIGNAASGKSSLDKIYDAWVKDENDKEELMFEKEKEYRRKKNAAKNKKDQPEEPVFPIRLITGVNTLPNIVQRLANIDGTTGVTYTAEIDSITGKWKQNIDEISPMLRQSYDGVAYAREARSAEAVNAHIKQMRWFLIGNGTPDALHRLITNYTDGLLTRLSIARLPDNTFSALPQNPPTMTEKNKEHILAISKVLPHMRGTLDLPKLEEQSSNWAEDVRLDSMKNFDAVKAGLRMRSAVNAYRKVVCLMLALVAERLIEKYGVEGAIEKLDANADLTQDMMLRAQTPSMMKAFDILADSLLETTMSFFYNKIKNAQEAMNKTNSGYPNGRRRGKNDSIYSVLSHTFDSDDAMNATIRVMGTSNINKVNMMLRNWRNQGLVREEPDGTYTKLMA